LAAARGDDEALRVAVEEAAAAARGLGRTVQRGDLWATAVGRPGDAQCCLVFAPAGWDQGGRRGTVSPEGADLRIVERAAMVTALLLLSQRSAAAAEDRVRGELLDDLLSGRLGGAKPSAGEPGTEDPGVLHERARRLGVALGAPTTLLVLRPSAGARHRLATWAAGHAADHGGLAAERDGSSVLLLPGDDPGAVARRVAREIKSHVGAGVTVGAGGPASGPAGIAEAHRTAQRCAGALVALGLAGTAAAPADLGFVGLLMGGAPQDIDGFVTTTIGAVLDYDQRRGTVLRQTLESYFLAGSSPARAAELLHVHVNTVTQRLERLATLLGEEWQRPDRALEIQLALRLHRLRAQS
jgi:hypothetical protein